MKMAKRMVTALLALAMTLSLASCADTSWVVRSGDETISAGVYLSYLFDAYYGQTYTYTYTGQDPATVFDNQIEEKDAAQWMKDTALDSVKRNIVYRNYMEELGLSFTEDEINSANEQADSMYDQLEESLTQGGIGQESFRTFFQQSMAASKVFDGLYGEGGTKEVPTEDIRSYWEENYYRVKVISSSLLDDTGAELSETDQQVITDRLDGYRDQINNGEATIDELIEIEQNVQAASSESESSDSTSDTSSTGESTASDDSSAASSDASDASEDASSAVDSEASSDESSDSASSSEESSTDAESSTQEESSSASSEEETTTEEEPTDSASYVSKTDETMPERTEALESLEVGQATTFTSNNVYYVIQLLPYDGDDADLVDQTFETNQTSLLQEMKSDEFNEDIDGRLANLEVTVNDAAINRYDPKKFLVE